MNSGLVDKKLTKEELKSFIGDKNIDYYEKRLDIYFNESADMTPKWNWAAFVFGFFWMAYRKMYLCASAIIPLYIILRPGGIRNFIHPFIVFLWVLIGMYSNRIYYEHAKIKINKIKNMRIGNDEKNQKIRQSGGTNKIAVIILAIILVIIISALPTPFFKY